MRFVKFKEDYADITTGVEYEVKFETEIEIVFIDNSGDVRTVKKSKAHFEIIDRPVMVKVWDDNENGKISKELIQDLGESVKYRYMCRNTNTNEMAGWKNIEYIEEKLTLEQRIEKLEQQLNKI